MRIVTREGQLSPPLKGVPEVWASGQGGLLDVVLDKSHCAKQDHIFCFAERTGGGGRTRWPRAKLNDADGRLDDVKIIFRQEDRCRRAITMAAASRRQVTAICLSRWVNISSIATRRKTLQSPRQADPDRARRFRARRQSIRRPHRREAGNLSYGHRNEQGLAINPPRAIFGNRTRPRGGDEVTSSARARITLPVIGYGIDYSGAKFTRAPPGAAWSNRQILGAVDRPSGMAFYTANLFPKWTGSLFTGALAGRMLVRLSLNGNTVTGEEHLLRNLNERIRDVRQGPDGALWLLTDNSAGRILRVSPR